MHVRDWNRGVYTSEAWRRAGGRRRYNAQRLRAAEARRAEIERRIGDFGIVMACARRTGVCTALARVFGVHRTTIGRDIQELFNPEWEKNVVRPDGEIVYTLIRARRSGRVLKVYDGGGRRIRGPERRRIVRTYG